MRSAPLPGTSTTEPVTLAFCATGVLPAVPVPVPLPVPVPVPPVVPPVPAVDFVPLPVLLVPVVLLPVVAPAVAAYMRRRRGGAAR